MSKIKFLNIFSFYLRFVKCRFLFYKNIEMIKQKTVFVAYSMLIWLPLEGPFYTKQDFIPTQKGLVLCQTALGK